MNNTRYTYEKVTLSEAEAIERCDQRIEGVKERIDELQDELAEALNELIALQYGELDREATIRHTLNPGDPGYDEAPDHFDELKYRGDIHWINIPRNISTP